MLCQKSGMIIDDVLYTLESMNCMYTIQKQGPLLVISSDLLSGKNLQNKLKFEFLQ